MPTNWSKEKEEQLMANNRFRQLLGIEVEKIEEGTAVLSLRVTDQMLQAANIVHGGVIATMADSVIGSALRTVLPDGVIGSTVEMNINYFRPAKHGRILAEGRVVHSGRTLSVGVADIKDEEGRLLATGRGTYAVRPRS